MNGTNINPLAGFEIVTDIAGGRWFGKVIADDDAGPSGAITLEPAYEMAPRQFIAQQTQQGLGLVALSMPGMFPLFDRPSRVPVRVRWASRIALTCFQPEDQKFFADALVQSDRASRAARAGLAL
jgi:hypothetical protein